MEQLRRDQFDPSGARETRRDAAADEERYAVARKLLLGSFGSEPKRRLRMFMLHYGATIGPLVVSVLLCAAYPRVWTYILAGILAGFVANVLGLLMHEASQFFFHSDKRTNDLLANALVCLPIFNTVAGYRGPHLDHHRHAGTPLDLYERLYRGYRGGADVGIWLLGDLLLVSSIDRFVGRYLGRTDKTSAPLNVTTLGALVLVQGGLFGLYAVVTGWYWLYVVLWLLPLMTVPQVINRIRTFPGGDYAGELGRLWVLPAGTGDPGEGPSRRRHDPSARRSLRRELGHAQRRCLAAPVSAGGRVPRGGCPSGATAQPAGLSAVRQAQAAEPTFSGGGRAMLRLERALEPVLERLMAFPLLAAVERV
jgi:hypothetical protein